MKLFPVLIILVLAIAGCVNLASDIYSEQYILTFKNESNRSIKCLILDSSNYSQNRKEYTILPHTNRDVYTIMYPKGKGFKMVIFDDKMKTIYEIRFANFRKSLIKVKTIVYGRSIG